MVGWGGAVWSGPLLEYPSRWLLNAIPAILGAESIAVAWAIRRDGLRPNVVRALVLLLALLAAGSILYFPDYVHVLFVTPFALVALAALAYGLRPPRSSRAMRIALSAAWIVVVVLIGAKAWRNAGLMSRDNPVRFETEQIQSVTELLTRDPEAIVAVNTVLIGRGDPMLSFLVSRYREVGGVGFFRIFVPRDRAGPWR